MDINGHGKSWKTTFIILYARCIQNTNNNVCVCVCVVKCETPTLQPLPSEAGEDDRQYMECPHCNVITVSRTNWEGSDIIVICFHQQT